MAVTVWEKMMASLERAESSERSNSKRGGSHAMKSKYSQPQCFLCGAYIAIRGDEL